MMIANHMNSHGVRSSYPQATPVSDHQVKHLMNSTYGVSVMIEIPIYVFKMMPDNHMNSHGARSAWSAFPGVHGYVV